MERWLQSIPSSLEVLNLIEPTLTCWYKKNNAYIFHNPTLHNRLSSKKHFVYSFCSCQNSCIHKLHILMAYFLHELMQYACSIVLFEKIYTHKLHIQMAYFLHEQMQHVLSSYSFQNNCNHRNHIWMAYFLHELMQHYLSSIQENSHGYKQRKIVLHQQNLKLNIWLWFRLKLCMSLNFPKNQPSKVFGN